MNFRDIPQYPRSNYAVHVGLHYLEEHVAHYAGYGFTMDPEYQRGHVWTAAQRERYVEHILQGGETGRDILINCYNWQGRRRGVDPNKCGPAEVLDGKQRLTSLLMFLRGEVRAFGRVLSEFEGKPRADIIWRVVDFDAVEVLDTYLMLNAGGTVHDPVELERVRGLRDAARAARLKPGVVG